MLAAQTPGSGITPAPAPSSTPLPVFVPAPVTEFHFEYVEFEKPQGQGQGRTPSLATVRSTGHTLFTTNATEDIEALARSQGVDPENFEFRVCGDKRGFVALRPVRPGLGKNAPTRRRKSSGNIVTYLDSLFHKIPELRPDTTLQCNLFETTDDEGKPCIGIALGNALKKTPSTVRSAIGSKDSNSSKSGGGSPTATQTTK